MGNKCLKNVMELKFFLINVNEIWTVILKRGNCYMIPIKGGCQGNFVPWHLLWKSYIKNQLTVIGVRLIYLMNLVYGKEMYKEWEGIKVFFK